MRGRGKLCEIVSQPQSEPSTCATSSKDTSSGENDSETDVVCPVCKFPESKDSENTEWVQCDNSSCSKWYHVLCTSIDPHDYNTLGSATWLCQCSGNITLMSISYQIF